MTYEFLSYFLIYYRVSDFGYGNYIRSYSADQLFNMQFLDQINILAYNYRPIFLDNVYVTEY
ncbi:hypothetical protein A3F02_02075 [Candidatus Curtissbacteria bacterium RIFCSPHIGHO2_12_FULL_38_9b]|uniref:Uncharacterized protein n=1 Tax=Candidatus Curtissbacteria bacterium RIFCSPHIGHO2_12_FULL_38_9b TaxID=1797720 RepID=A0A1F5GZ02_9BACT|nr:MAG: hypothetical protein A3F02_02075 [Candidatus Curtissbacteria bacterium RIFCSPHIGHO2_12_FULL_38_9b]